MALPSTGGSVDATLTPSLNPLAVRYWQITHALIRDYYNADGTVFKLNASSAGLGSNGLMNVFATDGNIRSDLLITASGSNLGFYDVGEMKEDMIAVTSDMTVQQTPTAASVRTVRNVLTKLDDKVAFTMKEAGPLMDYLRYELPLANGIPDIGTAGYQVTRAGTDVLVPRIVVLIGVDAGQLKAEVFPCVYPDKKGKDEWQRKNSEELEWTGEPILDPYTGTPMYICRDGAQWRSLGGVPTLGTVTATPISGLKVTLSFAISGLDVGSGVSFTATKTTGGTPTALTLMGSPSISDGVVTLTGTSLTASTSYTGLITATGDNGATATVAIPSFTSLSS